MKCAENNGYRQCAYELIPKLLCIEFYKETHKGSGKFKFEFLKILNQGEELDKDTINYIQKGGI